MFRHTLILAIFAAWPALPAHSELQSPQRQPDDSVPVPFERVWEYGPLRLEFRLSDTRPRVSDQVTVDLTVNSPPGVEVKLPGTKEIPKDFQISDLRETGPTEQPNGELRSEMRFKFEVLHGGAYEWPALSIRFRATGDSEWSNADTEPVPVEFRSMLEEGRDSVEPRPNPGPLGWPMEWWFWILAIGLLAAVLVGALVTLVAWRRGARPIAPMVRQSPYRLALDAIARIEAAGYLERGEVDRFYTELSGVIRHYIEGQFGLRAPEQTTEEFLQALMAKPVLLRGHRDALASFLEQCDLVKFARVRPTRQEGQNVLSAARGFVEATRGDAMIRETAIESEPASS